MAHMAQNMVRMIHEYWLKCVTTVTVEQWQQSAKEYPSIISEMFGFRPVNFDPPTSLRALLVSYRQPGL
jgi:hypothetical protein